MKSVIPLLLLPVLVGLAGCLPVSQNPLSSPDSAVADTRLAGLWYGKSDEDIVFLHIIPGDTAKMDVVEVDHRKGQDPDTSAYTIFPTVLGGVHYLNVQMKKSADKTYHLARYHISSAGTLTIWLMSEKPVIKAIDSEKISGKVGKQDPGQKVDTREVKITASTKHLAAFVSKSDPEVLFADKFCSFKKVTLPALEPASSPSPTPKGKSSKKKKISE